MNLGEAIQRVGLEKHSTLIHHLARPSIRLVASRLEGDILRGASRIGGCPDLPAGVSWPRIEEEGTRWSIYDKPDEAATQGYLPFVAQINFAKITDLDEEKILPPRGSLYFFGADWESGLGAHQVLFFDVDEDALQPANFPDDFPVQWRYPLHALQSHRQITLPSYARHGTIGGGDYRRCFFDVFEPEIEFATLDEKEQNAYRQLRALLGDSAENNPAKGEHHRLLGYAEYEQNPMQLDLQRIAENIGLDYETYLHLCDPEHPETRRLKTAAQESAWTLLLQVDSILSVPNMSWGDGGLHYIWMRRKDLQRRDFSQTFYDLQMG